MLNRTLCSVLEEMRDQYKTRNFAGLLGLVEEAQSMGNRMEAALEDQKDLERLLDNKRKLERRFKKIKKILKQARELAEENGQEDLSKDLKEIADLISSRYDW